MDNAAMLAGGILKIPNRRLPKTEVRLTQKVNWAMPCCTLLPDPRERYKSKSENKINHTGKGLSTIPLFPSIFGAYTVSLGFGIPKQSRPLILDTACHLVWLPWTPIYNCSDCSFPNINLPRSPTFNPIN